MQNDIIFKKNDSIAEIILNRPNKLNALTFDMVDRISEIGEDLKKEKQLKLVIIKGSKNVFSSGIDINQFHDLKENFNQIDNLLKEEKPFSYNRLQKSCIIWKTLNVPVISILEGPVYGAGLQLALGTDIRIAANDAKFSIMEIKWGLIPDMGISQLIPSLLTYDKALELALTAKIIKAPKAKKLGLVTKTVSDPYKKLDEYIKIFNNMSIEAIKDIKFLFSKMWEKDKNLLLLEAKIQKKLLYKKIK